MKISATKTITHTANKNSEFPISNQMHIRHRCLFIRLFVEPPIYSSFWTRKSKLSIHYTTDYNTKRVQILTTSCPIVDLPPSRMSLFQAGRVTIAKTPIPNPSEIPRFQIRPLHYSYDCYNGTLMVYGVIASSSSLNFFPVPSRFSSSPLFTIIPIPRVTALHHTDLLVDWFWPKVIPRTLVEVVVRKCVLYSNEPI